MPFNIFSSNRLEMLADVLAELVKSSPLPPLAPETVVVQSRGMARWLALGMAARLSVWANVECPFPNKLVDDLFEAVLPENREPLFDRESMAWRIMGLLPELVERPAFSMLNKHGADPLKRFQLSCRLADLFDQYILYRPDLIQSWDKGRDTHWQALLWREIRSTSPFIHRAALLNRFFARLAKPPADLSLPSRISIFGISSMPPFHLRVFAALAERVEVNLFFMNPCEHYWSDIASGREMARVRKREGQGTDQAALYLEQGNRLLASMGHLGRDFFTLLQEFNCEYHDFFTKPAGSSLLASIQSDILALKESEGDLKPDNSITFQSCHSPMREVEVLRDHLLHLFETDSDLRPRDILVMMPDIENYGPLIQAVFDVGRDDPCFMPFSIADTAMQTSNRLLADFFSLLDLASSRFSVSRVAGILECDSLQRRFGLGRDVDLIDRWIRETRIRWGRSGQDKEKLGLPPFNENSWQAGLDRLLLGYAMEGDQLFNGILPYGGMEGSDAEGLGRLLECLQVVFRFCDRLAKGQSLADWSQLLLELLDECFEVEQEDQDDFLFIRHGLLKLAFLQDETDFKEIIDPRVLRPWLEEALGRELSPFGFLTGGLTFCSMLPMRAVPFKVICLLGMNDADFPRPQTHVSFDLMAATPRTGDRSRRLDDRYLFLEALLSARKELYLSYVGRSIKDDSSLPPSVLVTELLDTICDGIKEDADQKEKEKNRGSLVTEHCLQSFNPACFHRDSGPRSYSAVNFVAAQVLAGEAGEGADFRNGLPLVEPGDEFRELSLDDLIRFFCHPARYFCERRLGLFLRDDSEPFEEKEPFDLTGLERYHLENVELAARRRDKDSSSLFERARAEGVLPHGPGGELVYRELEGDVDRFARSIAQIQGKPLEPVSLQVKINGFTVQAHLANLYETGLLHCRYATVKAKDLLRAWLSHLLINIESNACPSEGCSTRLVGKDQIVTWLPHAESRDILADLLDLYWQGLSVPLPFFPATSLAFAELALAEEQQKALAAAYKVWNGGYQRTGEGEDVYLQLFFRDQNPFDEYFAELAMRIFSPLLENQE